MHPILFKIGPFSVYTYGVTAAIAFSLASFFIWRNAPSFGIDRGRALDLLIWVLVCGILGARLLHVLVNIDYYKKSPYEILNLTGGGLAFYGGLFSGVIAGILFIKRNNLPLFKTGDLIAPYLAMAQSIGRIGCFMNGCCWGKVSAFGIISGIDGVIRHPTQLYSSLGLVLIFLILRLLYRIKIFDGGISLSYLLLYSIFRFCIDFLRADTPRYWLGLTVSQLISIFLFASASFFMVKIHSSWKNTPSK